MSESITPEWLEACGFRFDANWDVFDLVGNHGCVVEVRFHPVTVRMYGRHGDSRRVIQIPVPTRSAVRSAWHALTGTRLAEPMPADIAESTLILADKYEDDGFGDQAAYVRSLVSENERLKREIDEWHNDSITGELNTEMSAVDAVRHVADGIFRMPHVASASHFPEGVADFRTPVVRTNNGLYRLAEDWESPDGFIRRSDL